MKRETKRAILFECVQDFLVSHVITFAGALRGGSMLVALLIPEKRLAALFCARLGVSENSHVRLPLTLAVIVIINVSCILAAVLFLKIGAAAEYGRIYAFL